MDIIIVDDEPLARGRLQRMLSDEPGYRVVGQAGNAEETLAAVLQLDPDLVLLDIQMPGDSGLQAAARLAALEDPPAVIFCTAYGQYALDAFAVNAQNYLLKPVCKEQLLQALDQARRLNRAQRQQVLAAPISAMAAVNGADQEVRTHITARTRRGLELIPLDRVCYFAADQKYVTVYHEGGETLIDDTLKELEQEFGQRLLRTHRSVLVMRERVEAMEKNGSGQYELRLRDCGHRPPVSRRHVAQLRDWLSHL